MIIEVNSRSDMSGLMAYLTGEEKGHELIANNIGDMNYDQQVDALVSISEQNPRLKNNVFHASLSLPVGETLALEQWKSVATDFMKHMGYNDAPWTAILHQDRDHQHIHIAASRSSYTGSTISDSNSYRRANEFARMIEIKLGITQVESPDWTGEKKNSTQRERQVQLRGEKLIKTQIKETINETLKTARGKDFKTFAQDFFNQLKQKGIKTDFHKHKNGNIFGITYHKDNLTFKASKLGKAFQYKQLQKSILQAFASQPGIMKDGKIHLEIPNKVNSFSPTGSGTSRTPYLGPTRNVANSDYDEYEEEEKKKKNQERGM